MKHTHDIYYKPFSSHFVSIMVVQDPSTIFKIFLMFTSFVFGVHRHKLMHIRTHIEKHCKTIYEDVFEYQNHTLSKNIFVLEWGYLYVHLKFKWDIYNSFKTLVDDKDTNICRIIIQVTSLYETEN